MNWFEGFPLFAFSNCKPICTDLCRKSACSANWLLISIVLRGGCVFSSVSNLNVITCVLQGGVGGVFSFTLDLITCVLDGRPINPTMGHFHRMNSSRCHQAVDVFRVYA